MASEPPMEPAELLAIIDRLEELLGRSDLSEIEVEAGSTAFVLRAPSALAPPAATAAGVAATAGSAAAQEQPPVPGADARPQRAVLAPLTGLFYDAPSPGAEPYVRVGTEVHIGQVIGLIEAMKLFNEIKSDLAGRVTRIHVESGALVKAKQPLIEVGPL